MLEAALKLTTATCSRVSRSIWPRRSPHVALGYARHYVVLPSRSQSGMDQARTLGCSLMRSSSTVPGGKRTGTFGKTVADFGNDYAASDLQSAERRDGQQPTLAPFWVSARVKQQQLQAVDASCLPPSGDG